MYISDRTLSSEVPTVDQRDALRTVIANVDYFCVPTNCVLTRVNRGEKGNFAQPKIGRRTESELAAPGKVHLPS